MQDTTKAKNVPCFFDGTWVFRLRWANSGQVDRKLDYQVWCRPSMGAFNAWTTRNFSFNPQERRVVLVADNLMLDLVCITSSQYASRTRLQY